MTIKNENATLAEITVKPPDEKELPTLTEKLKDFGATKRTRTTRAKRTTKTKQIDANLISKLAPTLVATFVATYSRQMLKDPYKVCAPSQQEVITIIAPLFNILSRQIEITGQASETVIDLITCAIASIIFGTRAYVTYASIKEQETNGKSHENVTTPTTTDQNGTRGGDSTKDYSDTRTDRRVSSNGTNDIAIGDNGDSDEIKRDTQLFSELFTKDVEGRIRLGLLPPRLQN